MSAHRFTPFSLPRTLGEGAVLSAARQNPQGSGCAGAVLAAGSAQEVAVLGRVSGVHRSQASRWARLLKEGEAERVPKSPGPLISCFHFPCSDALLEK